MASTKPQAPAPSSATPTRRPYKGSCHCGKIKYIAYITLPPPFLSVKDRSTTRIRKCNCSTCHKMGLFHIRLINEPEDFLLLSPSNPFEGLSDYMCFDNLIHWFFCGTCGVRCFSYSGAQNDGEEREVEIDGVKTRVWTAKREGWASGLTEKGYDYLTVNATTIEPGQEGFDMREWHEKGWIYYLDTLGEVGEPRLGKPHEGGMY